MRLGVMIGMAVTMLGAGAMLHAQAGRSAEVQLKAAQQKADVEGDLKGAIDAYKKIVASAGGNRALAAQALVRMAECYQKLGDAKARQIYQQIVRDYHDQTKAVTIAHARLGSADVPVRAKGDRVVKAGDQVTWGDGRVSADGRFISYTDWNFTGNLMLHDLASGTDRALTGNTDWSVGNAYSSTFSPDGKQIAYGWRAYGKTYVNELRVLRPDSPTESRRIYGNPDISFFDPTDWSPDGQWIAVKVTRRDRTGQIALVRVQDGAFRPLKTIGWRGPKKIFFSPDGKYLAYDVPARDTDVQRDVFVIAADGSRETAVVQHPSDDAVMGWSPDGRELLFASDRTGVVGLWSVAITDGKAHGAPTLLKPDVGSVVSQGLTKAGSLHLVKDASTIGLYVAPIDLESGKLTGAPVLENFRSTRPDWSPDSKLLAYKSTTHSGRQVLSIRAATGELRTLPISLQYMAEPKWFPDKQSVLVAGRDLTGRGGYFRVDVETGRAALLAEMDGNTGRPQVSPDGTKIYYNARSAEHPEDPAFVERDVATGALKALLRVLGMGLGELSPDGRLFAEVTFDPSTKTSALSVIPVATGQPREVFRGSSSDRLQANGAVTWTPDSQAVVVVKTNPDQSEVRELWLVPVNGGEARRLGIDVRGWKPLGIRLDTASKHIAFFMGNDSREVWALENVAPTQHR